MYLNRGCLGKSPYRHNSEALNLTFTHNPKQVKNKEPSMETPLERMKYVWHFTPSLDKLNNWVKIDGDKLYKIKQKMVEGQRLL
jgi:hypothetical protein